jgi:zinc transport system ATP-binding protein
MLKMEDILEVDRLQVRFGKTEVIRDLSFNVARGSSLAVIGPNACGKSVLFRALIGSVPHTGSIRWARGTKLGFVPQKIDLERDLPVTGGDLLSAKAALSRASSDAIGHALGRVGLDSEVLPKLVVTMSGGQFQRLLVALALIGIPDVLLLDEPSAGIDAPGQEQLNEMLHRIQMEEGVTVLLISHDLSVVFRYATNVLCLGRGRPCIGPPRIVLTPETLREMYGTPAAFHVHDFA